MVGLTVAKINIGLLLTQIDLLVWLFEKN